jgi:hypothetical protein
MRRAAVADVTDGVLSHYSRLSKASPSVAHFANSIKCCQAKNRRVLETRRFWLID